MNRLFFGVLVLVLGSGGAYYFARGQSGQITIANAKFRTAKVERGEVVEGVQASGAVQPVTLVQVGSQISGVIDGLYHNDFNSKVKKDQPIAHLDSRRLAAQIAQDQANIDKAKADVARVRALIVQATKDLARQVTLAEKRLVGEADLDAANANVDSLKAQLALSQATVKSQEAQLESDKVNLEYATIVSPIDGVIVARNVDVGTTVAASLQAPVVYTIANDLTKIQVQASVPEADIGKIHEQQHARFVVDAHADKNFDGIVAQVRLASTTVQNVVTYTVIINADNPADEQNPNGLLLPGMTANVTFEVAKSAPDALKVPASALRLQPPKELIQPNVVQAQAKPDAAPSGKEKRPGGSGGKRGGGGMVYVVAPDGYLRPIAVKALISDGTMTSVEPREPDALAEGTEVITAVLTAQEEQQQQANPFMPQMGGPGRGGRGGGR